MKKIQIKFSKEKILTKYDLKPFKYIVAQKRYNKMVVFENKNNTLVFSHIIKLKSNMNYDMNKQLENLAIDLTKGKTRCNIALFTNTDAWQHIINLYGSENEEVICKLADAFNEPPTSILPSNVFLFDFQPRIEKVFKYTKNDKKYIMGVLTSYDNKKTFKYSKGFLKDDNLVGLLGIPLIDTVQQISYDVYQEIMV